MYIEKLKYKHLVYVVAAILISITLTTPANAQCTTDSIFLTNSSKVIFKCDKTEITPQQRQWVIDNMVPKLRELGEKGIIIGRSAASPEGPYANNRRLAHGRRETIKSIFEKEGINTSRIRFDTAIEEYDLLVEMMRQRHDADYQLVKNIVETHRNDDPATKRALQQVENGKLFARLLKEYFPELRAVRIMVYYLPDNFEIKVIDNLPPELITGFTPQRLEVPDAASLPLDKQERREIFSIKTNLLEYGAYVPKYGWCPMPNVAIEYYPRHGHMAYGAMFDCPWWIGNTTNHKYFELRNYTLEARYYTRSSDRSYKPGTNLPNGKAAFKGFYASAYAHAFLYQIGCNKYDGWIGEGAGAGLGLGYVLPLSKRNQHWRLEFGAQFGFFLTKYDPFVYGCPVENVEDGLYYYDYTGDADLFKKRQYTFKWFGPTRVGITLTYDILYRRISKRGMSLRRWEQKGGAQ